MVVLSLLLATCVVSCVSTMMTGDNGGPAAINNGPLNIKQTSISHVPKQCILDAAPGMCRASMPKYFFNIKTGQCERFIYGGCGGNWNRFDSLSECHRRCTCKVTPETGPCRGHIRRWYYSPADGCCRPFIYGGCGGNSNNYATWTECSNLCGYPTIDSKWWEWGADWWNLNANLNKTSGSTQSNVTNYSQDDFMRDWVLWGLLTGGEGELEMEDMAAMIAQAHILGFGKSTGASMGTGGTQASNTKQNTAHSLADTQAALRYFQRHFGNEEAMAGGGMGAGMQNFGPAYRMARPGSFTPVGQVGSVENMVGLGSRMYGAEAWENGGSMSDYMNQWGSGQFGQGYQSGGLGQDYMSGLFGQGSQAGLFGQGSHAMQFGQGSQSNQFGQGSMTGQGSQSSQFGQGSPSNQFGQGSMTGRGSQPMQFGQRSQQGQGMANSGNYAFQASAGELNSHGSMGQSITQNMGNTRNGWAPHGESVVPAAAGFGQFGNAASGGTMGEGSSAVLYVIGQLSSGNFNPTDFINLAKKFGALQPGGGVNVEVLAQRMVSSLQGPNGGVKLAPLKGLAKALGALDSNGNISAKTLMASLARSLGRGDLFGLGSKTGQGSGSGGTGVAGGGVGGQFTGGTSSGSSVQGSASASIGGGSSRKTYGKK